MKTVHGHILIWTFFLV